MKSTHESIFEKRQIRLKERLQDSGLDALALNPGPSLFYLTGLHFHLSERPVVLIFPAKGSPVVVLPELEVGKLQNLPYQVKSFPYGEDYQSWQNSFRQAAQLLEIDAGKIGVEPRGFRVLELTLLEQSAPQANIQSAEEIVASLRMYKDRSEVEAMKSAVNVAQQALHATLPKIKLGMTERQLANELTVQLLRCGSEPDLPFTPIVASGPNSANPHGTPSQRALASGDLLILDWGAKINGYASDLTRTFSLGEPNAELAHIADVVLEANAAARRKAAAGVLAAQVDGAAREVIERAGYGKYFIHRTGHGLGLEGHEEPYIRGDNEQTLAAGMTFTIEPGIYLPGRGGVRIEDDFVITDDGGESLSDLPRELIRI